MTATYEVLSNRGLLGHAKGDVVDLALAAGAARALMEAGHIKPAPSRARTQPVSEEEEADS